MLGKPRTRQGLDRIQAPYYGTQLPDVPNNIISWLRICGLFPVHRTQCKACVYAKHGLDKTLRKHIVHNLEFVNIPRTVSVYFFPCVVFARKWCAAKPDTAIRERLIQCQPISFKERMFFREASEFFLGWFSGVFSGHLGLFRPDSLTLARLGLVL